MAGGGFSGLTSQTSCHFPAGLTGFLLLEIPPDHIQVTVRLSKNLTAFC